MSKGPGERRMGERESSSQQAGPPSQFQQYPQTDVNEPIVLHEGAFRLRSGRRCIEARGSAHLRCLPSPGIRFDIEADEPPHVGLNFDSLVVELSGFKTKHVLAYSKGGGPTPRIQASAGAMEWGGGKQSLLSVGFQIMNLCDFLRRGPSAVPGDPTQTGGDYGTIETVSLEHYGWQIQIVALPDSHVRYRHLKATGGYAFTHVGQLVRNDGSAFSVDEAKDILESLRVFLSFACGAACHLPIQWGRGVDGGIVWRWFGSPVVDPWKMRLSWFDEHHGEILEELFDSFCRNYKNPKLHQPLVLALHWYRHCNTQSSGLEGSLILGMAGLELLGGLVVVDKNGSMTDKRYDRLPGAKKLQELLSALNVQADFPQRYDSLNQFAQRNGNWNACQALVKLRNGFVHADKRNRRIVFGLQGRTTSDALQLSIWYQELALLRLLGYRGSYLNRTTASLVGQVEPVPWSAP